MTSRLPLASIIPLSLHCFTELICIKAKPRAEFETRSRATFAEAAMPRKDPDFPDRLLVSGIGAVASLVVAIIAAAIFGSFWAQ
jgi:hypothetical protein